MNACNFIKLKYFLKSGFISNYGRWNIATSFFTILAISFLLSEYTLARDLSLDEAIEQALFVSRDLQISDLDIQNTKNSLYLAEAAKSFTIKSSINFEVNHINKEDVSFVNNYPEMDGSLIPRSYQLDNIFLHKINLNLNLVKSIYNFGKLDNISKAAQYSLDISKYKKRLLIRELRYNTNKAYYTALLSDILLELSKKSYEKALSNKEFIENGIAKPSRLDLILAKLHVSVQKLELDTTEQFKRDSYRALKFICKIPDDEIIALTSNMESLNLISNKEELKKSLESNPEIVIHKLLSKMHQQNFYAKKADRYPNLLFYLGYSGKMSANEIIFKQVYNENIIYTGIKIEAPVWDNGITEIIAKQEITEKIKADIFSFQCQDTLEEHLESIVEKHNNNIKIYKNQKNIVDSIQNSYKLSIARFKVGQTNITELNDIESKLTQSIKKLNILKFEINILKAEIRKLVDTI